MKKLLLLSLFLLLFSVSALCSKWTAKDLSVMTTDGLSLKATLTYPTYRKPLAAIAMATGSGIQNRDEEIFGHRPFKAIAEALSEAGYAVLRVDDRGFENPQNSKNATNDTFADDTRCALSVLDSLYGAQLPKGIIGHSEGGLTAIKLASESVPDFIITLAAPAWKGDSIVMSQSRIAAIAASGRWDAEEAQRRLLDVAMSEGSELYRRATLRSIISEQLGASASLSQVQTMITSQIESLLTPWYRDFLRTDPAKYIPRVQVPWLALNGDKDMQVLHENLQTIKGLNTKADTRLMPSLNHLFLKCATGLPNEYQALPGDIDPNVIQVMIEWLSSVI